MRHIKKYLALFIALLVFIFIILPICFGALANHYLHSSLKNWSKSHPDATYEITTPPHRLWNIWSSTKNIKISFGQDPILNLPVTLVYGPVIFNEGVHLGLAKIARNNTNIPGIPPTSYFGNIGLFGSISLYTHTPSPSNLLSLLSLLLDMKNPIQLNSVDTEIHTRLGSRAIDASIAFNQIAVQRKNSSTHVNQIKFSLANISEVHGDPIATLSLQLQGVDYQDSLHHVTIPSASFLNYQAKGSRFEAAQQLFESQKPEAHDSEMSRQFVEMLLLGLNSDTQISMSLQDESPMGTGTLDLEFTFPKLPKDPTPLEIIKYAKYQIHLSVPTMNTAASSQDTKDTSNDNRTQFALKQLLIQENQSDSAFSLDSLIYHQNTQDLLSLNGLNYQSKISDSFLARETSWNTDLTLQKICFTSHCINNVKLSNELKGLNKNAFLDNQADDLVNAMISLLFDDNSEEINIFPLKSLLTTDSEDIFNLQAALPHGNASIDLEISTPHFDPKKSLTQNIVASGVIKISSADLDSQFATTKTANKNPIGTIGPIGPYDIQQDSGDLFSTLGFIRQAWLEGGFIGKDTENGVNIETLIFNFTPGKPLQLNHQDFDDLHLAALYANLGYINNATVILNASKYQENPTAQKMRMQLLQAPQNMISNTQDAEENEDQKTLNPSHSSSHS